LAATPYAVIHLDEYIGGPAAQLDMYFQPTQSQTELGERLIKNVGFYWLQAKRALGPGTLALLALGLSLLLRQDWRSWLPRLLHPLTTVLVMSTPVLVYPRLILPAMGVVAIVAATPIAWLAHRWRLVAAAVALAAAIQPLRGSIRYANVTAYPSATDRLLDWVEAVVPSGGRILDTRPEADTGWTAAVVLGVDPAKHETLHFSVREDGRGLALLVREVDLVLTPTGHQPPWAEGLRLVYKARHTTKPKDWLRLGEPQLGQAITRACVSDVRPRYRAIDLARAEITASANQDELGRLHDGDPNTAWTSATAMIGREWIEILFDEPATVGRVELFLGYTPRRHGPELALLVRAEDGDVSPVYAAPLRPNIVDQLAARKAGSARPLSQMLVIEPRAVTGLRLVQQGVRPEPWALAELRIDAYEGEEPYRLPY
jgi:hypothetical protein